VFPSTKQDNFFVLMLYNDYPADSIEESVGKSLEADSGTSDAVIHILQNKCQNHETVFDTLDNWQRFTAPDISVYDQIGDGL